MGDAAIKVMVGVAVVAAVFFFLRRGGTTLSGAEAKALIESGGVLLDVRAPGEFRSGHPDEAVNIPVGELGSRLEELGSKDNPIVVYCQSGVRSASAVRLLKKHGFDDVRNLGSLNRWPQD